MNRAHFSPLWRFPYRLQESGELRPLDLLQEAPHVRATLGLDSTTIPMSNSLQPPDGQCFLPTEGKTTDFSLSFPPISFSNHHHQEETPIEKPISAPSTRPPSTVASLQTLPRSQSSQERLANASVPSKITLHSGCSRTSVIAPSESSTERIFNNGRLHLNSRCDSVSRLVVSFL